MTLYLEQANFLVHRINKTWTRYIRMEKNGISFSRMFWQNYPRSALPLLPFIFKCVMAMSFNSTQATFFRSFLYFCRSSCTVGCIGQDKHTLAVKHEKTSHQAKQNQLLICIYTFALLYMTTATLNSGQHSAAADITSSFQYISYWAGCCRWRHKTNQKCPKYHLNKSQLNCSHPHILNFITEGEAYNKGKWQRVSTRENTER